MIPQNTSIHASNSELIANGDLHILNAPSPRGKTAKRAYGDAGALEIKYKDDKSKSVLKNLEYLNGEGIKDLLKTSDIISKGFESLRDVARSLPIPTSISTHELGEDMKDINSTQKALAYFLQTTSGVKYQVYHHVGAVGCDVDEDEPQKVRTINFRLAKNHGLTEKDTEFMSVLQDSMNGNTLRASVELLALKHVVGRVLYEVKIECQGLQRLLGLLALHTIADQPFGEDSLEVLNWLASFLRAKEPPQSNEEQRKANPFKRAWNHPFKSERTL
ncbi:hypothetical protein CFIO01_02039 [Colletotrichum fioriniae PJ7]|uniref:Uncharacterized protein n=1 Tax=Colletotrichum fioriniae PJ7 TaxID=1445577 RepID=A0A010RMV7_9PEZI|nr:hypothetical protein CFIO01_02039 [Colletotrichum fioriniae PJ7]